MKRYCGLIVGGVLLVVAAISVGQAPAPTTDPLVGSELSPRAVAPAPPPSVTAKPETAKEKSIDELLARLDAIKAQQEELEKTKKETVALLKEKLKQQKERLKNLGVTIEEVVPPQPNTSQ